LPKAWRNYENSRSFAFLYSPLYYFSLSVLFHENLQNQNAGGSNYFSLSVLFHERKKSELNLRADFAFQARGLTWRRERSEPKLLAQRRSRMNSLVADACSCWLCAVEHTVTVCWLCAVEHTVTIIFLNLCSIRPNLHLFVVVVAGWLGWPGLAGLAVLDGGAGLGWLG
jgi:hypothetical protein